MRVYARISFPARREEVRDLFEALGAADELGVAYQCLNFYTDTEEYQRLTEELQRRGIEYRERRLPEYTVEELLAPEFLIMRSGNYWGYPKPETGYRKLCFDFATACPMCHNGARQIAPLRLSKPPPKRARWVMLHWIYEYLIHEEIANRMQEQGLTGVELWPLLHHPSRREIPGWKQIFFAHELPPMSSRTKPPQVKEDAEFLAQYGQTPTTVCPCGKRGYNSPFEIYYPRSVQNQFKDFNHSREWFSGSMTTYPEKIISQRVFRFILDRKLKHLPALFQPVFWAEEE